MNKLMIILASVTLFASCAKKKPVVFENDTDFHDWINPQSIKDIPNAHSGFSASVIDSSRKFSLGFSKTIEGIGKVKEVTFSYWVFAKNENAKVSTVFSVDFNGQNIDWSGRPVLIKEFNKWIEVHETYKISDKAKPNNQLTTYVLNESKEQIYIDDLKVEFK
jgi:hypothetical protein